jgi:hypothetical protein
MTAASEEQKDDKKAYWQSELKSLGIESRRSNDLNNNQELENLTDAVKQSMYQDYKMAYGKDGDKHQEEAESTIKS